MTITKRIPSPYLLAEELVEETGVEAIDEFLFSLVNILQVSLASHLRAVYLIGSYATGGYRPDSDLDLCLLWKEDADWQTHCQKGWTLTWLYSRGTRYVIDPMWNHLETPFYTATDLGDPGYMPCGPIIRLALKEHSRLLWGEDIRSRIALGNGQDMHRDVLMPPINWMRRMIHHLSENEQITMPLTAPSPEAGDLGYGGQSKVITYVLHMARALIFLETGEFSFEKLTIAERFQQVINGPWNAVIGSMHKLAYGSVGDTERQACYLTICRRLPAFENAFLARIHESGYAYLLNGDGQKE